MKRVKCGLCQTVTAAQNITAHLLAAHRYKADSEMVKLLVRK